MVELTDKSANLVLRVMSVFEHVSDGSVSVSVEDGRDTFGDPEQFFEIMKSLVLFAEALGYIASFKLDDETFIDCYEIHWRVKGEYANLSPVL